MKTRRYAIPSAHAVGTRVPEPCDRTTPSTYAQWPCPECGSDKYYTYLGEPCFDCGQKRNPFVGGLLVVLIDAGGEDSPHPERIADGTAGYNMGLPPIETVVGTRPDGKPKTVSRPVSNNELGSNRGVREYAKRNGVEPMTRGRFRGLR